MPRLARVVAPGHPHHVTQRGNRRQQTFFCDDDYVAYLGLMAEWCGRCGVEIWAYCLMPNHVHLIAVPAAEEALRAAIGEAHRRYTRRVNFREGWRGHLWQGRFGSCVLDDLHLRAAARYVEMNPVRAGLTALPEDYRWSSARAHVAGHDDALVRAAPLLELIGDWTHFLAEPEEPDLRGRLQAHERTGRPLGGPAFVAGLEATLHRPLSPRRAGRKPKRSSVSATSIALRAGDVSPSDE